MMHGTMSLKFILFPFTQLWPVSTGLRKFITTNINAYRMAGLKREYRGIRCRGKRHSLRIMEWEVSR